MDEEKIWSHISRKISGEETAEDATQVNEWIENKPVNKQTYDILSETWNSRVPSSNTHNSLFESIKRRITVYENRHKRPFYTTTLFRAAAVIFLILASNFMVHVVQEKINPPKIITWQEIDVPRGNRMKLILPDKSSVWLNNETHFKYASDYSSGNRVVELSGEAYFDIQHDAKHPFVVNIGDEHIKVLGTKFSVKAYPEDRVIETSLITGSVEFDTKLKINGESRFLIEPGYSLFYDKQNNSLTRQKIQSSYYEYWEKGVYAFKDESFESLAVKIKRIFNVEIIFKDEYLKKKTFTGTININDNIFLFMEAIRLTSVEPIEYEYDKNIINVKLRK